MLVCLLASSSTFSSGFADAFGMKGKGGRPQGMQGQGRMGQMGMQGQMGQRPGGGAFSQLGQQSPAGGGTFNQMGGGRQGMMGQMGMQGQMGQRPGGGSFSRFGQQSLAQQGGGGGMFNQMGRGRPGGMMGGRPQGQGMMAGQGQRPGGGSFSQFGQQSPAQQSGGQFGGMFGQSGGMFPNGASADSSSSVGIGSAQIGSCSAKLVQLQTGPSSTCSGGNTHFWPVDYAPNDCHGWKATDPSGREHLNSANQMTCNIDGSFSFVQYPGNLNCQGGGTYKSFSPGICQQGTSWVEGILNSYVTLLACCSYTQISHLHSTLFPLI